MEEVQQGSNGTESQTAIIPTTITTSQFSQIAQQVNRCLVHCYKRKGSHYYSAMLLFMYVNWKIHFID